jgi:glucan phosphoethanolaminetransferase (alkaline phosphatase superfamily)
METTETPEQTLSEQPKRELILGEEAKYFLHTAGRWATFLGIMGFIGTGFVVIIAFFIGALFSFISRLNPAASQMPAGISGIFTFVYLLVAVFYFFMSYYLYQFGTSIKSGTLLNDATLATKAFKNLKSHLKLIGITTIVAISLYILILIISLIVGIGATTVLSR